MRVFVAVVPPEAAVAEARRGVAALRGLPGAERLRWTEPEGWHLTLAFLGEVEPEAVPGVEARLEFLSRTHPDHELCLRGGGTFGARALWLGVGGEVRRLRALAEDARGRLLPDPGADQPFRAHLTLARSGVPRNAPAGSSAPGASRAPSLRPFADALAGFSGTPWRAGALHLMRSHLGGGPARYETLGTWPLGG